MVVNTGKQTKNGGKNTPMPQENTDVEYTGYRRGPRGKCAMATSLVFNMMMLALLIGAGVYLCRYRREICRMKIDHGIAVAEMTGVDYEVKDCKVQLIYKDGLFTPNTMELKMDEINVPNNPEEGELEIAPEDPQDGDGEKKRKRHRHHHRGPEPRVPPPKKPE